jgi:hypothetical protein
MNDRPDILHHYTHPLHLNAIMEERALWTTESNISITSEHYGPDVVWAVDTLWVPEVEGDHLAHGLLPDKLRVRIDFKTPKRAYKWTEWAWTAKMPDWWRDTLIRVGGGEEAADHWWVVDHLVISKHWTAVYTDGTLLTPPY